MYFDKKIYESRRTELIKKVGKGIIILSSNTESARNFMTNTYSFVQDSSFLYYAGINQPDLVLIINCATEESILFGEDSSLEHTIWMGSQEFLSEKAAKVGINKIIALNHLTNYIKKDSVRSNLHYLPIYRSSSKLFLSKTLGKSANEVSSNVSLNLIKAIISQRKIKSKEEIQKLEEALVITKAMHFEVIGKTREGQKESNLLGDLVSVALSEGGKTAYSPIVSVQGQILHNFNYLNELKKGQLLLGDFGAQSYAGYAGNITRTIPVSRKFSNKQKEVYQIVLGVQKASIKMLKPDVLFEDVHFAACVKIVEGLKDLDLMKGDAEEAVTMGAHALFFPHGLGHMIGLDVHDMESLGENYVGYDDEISKSKQFGLKSLRLGKRLKKGFIVTIEPGVYFIPELYHDWKSNNKQCAPFLNFNKITTYLDFGGIRIEDECLVTNKGYKELEVGIPKEIKEIERVMICQ